MTERETAPGAQRWCSDTFEEVPANRRKNTHTCLLAEGHEPPHQCPICKTFWWPDGTASFKPERVEVTEDTR